MSQVHVGWVLASETPSLLAEFYSFAMNAKVTPGRNNSHFWVQHSGGMTLQVYRPSRSKSFPTKGRASALCLWRDPSADPLAEIDDWSSTLIAKGAKLSEKPRMESFGAESWMKDPEGNCFLILIPIE